MTAQTLTPMQLVRDGTGLDITALLATPTQTTLQFANSGREFLLAAAGAGAETVTVDVGVTILGQTVTKAGTNTVQVVLSTTTSITVALLQYVGVS